MTLHTVSYFNLLTSIPSRLVDHDSNARFLTDSKTLEEYILSEYNRYTVIRVHCLTVESNLKTANHLVTLILVLKKNLHT